MIKMNNVLSKRNEVRFSVPPRGGVLGATLLSTYINDLISP